MLRQGPIPRVVHGAIEYLAGVLLIASGFLLSFESSAAVAASIILGLLVLVMAASSDGPSSLINTIPLSVHVLLDYALAGVLVAAPFLFGFSDETAATAFFIILGVVHLLVTIGTRFRAEKEA